MYLAPCSSDQLSCSGCVSHCGRSSDQQQQKYSSHLSQDQRRQKLTPDDHPVWQIVQPCSHTHAPVIIAYTYALRTLMHRVRYNIPSKFGLKHTPHQVPYSGKFSLGANFRDFRGLTWFRENKNREKLKMEIDDVIYVCTSSTRVNEMVLYSLSAL